MYTINDQFEEWLGKINYTKDSVYPFRVRVGCVKAAPPRHERFEFIREMGAGKIDAVFDGSPLGSDDLTFVFPERHMSVHEQQAFMSKLTKHPDADKIRTVDMITSSPLLIGNFVREQILILTWDDDVIY